jgi:demethylmenaquinone methyltransferase/2-methoxy-6-polyprenyl-1,4-benzoquinol methylase
MPLRKPSEPKTSNNRSPGSVPSAALTPVAGPNVRAMFDRIASDYDRFNAWASLGLHHHWRRALLKRVPKDARVLDIATGTGDVAFLAAQEGHDVVGLDFSQAMLDKAKEKSTHAGLPAGRQVRWMNGSADRLPFSDRSFGCVTSAFALRNLRGCIEAAFKENFRILRNGGKVVHMDFGRPTSALSRWGHEVHLHFGIPLIGQWLCGDRWPKGYLETTIREFYEPAEVVELLKRAGFSDVRHTPLSLGVVQLFEGTKKC